MRAFEVLPDLRDYKYFNVDIPASYQRPVIYFNGVRIGPHWRPPRATEVVHPMRLSPDFWNLWLRCAFAMETDRAAVIEPVLRNSCELLPMRFHQFSFVALNILSLPGAVDYDRSTIAKSRVVKYAFVPDRISTSLFKLPEKESIFCAEGLRNGVPEFKATVERLRLTGLRFKLIWDEEHPEIPLPVQPLRRWTARSNNAGGDPDPGALRPSGDPS